MRSADFIIIGAGTSGLYTAKHLRKYSNSIIVVDRHHKHCSLDQTPLAFHKIVTPRTKSLANIKDCIINGNPLFWLLLIFNIPFVCTHKNALYYSTMLMKHDKIISPHLSLRSNKSLLCNTVWKNLKEYLDTSGVNFIRGDVVEVNSHSVTLADGEEIMFRDKVFICTGSNLDLIPFWYKLFVCRYSTTEGTRVVSPDFLPFHVEIVNNVTWITGGSFENTFTLFATTLDAVERGNDASTTSVNRFGKRLFYGTLAVLLFFTMYFYGNPFSLSKEIEDIPAKQILMAPEL